MSSLLEPVAFEFDDVGELTQSRYAGTFEVKPVLSWADKIRADRICRDLLGENPPNEESAIYQRAFISGQLAVRVLKAPEWWTGKGNGSLMVDENIPVSVYSRCVDAEDKVRQSFKAGAAGARAEIKEELAKK